MNDMKKNTALDPKKHLDPGLDIHGCEDLPGHPLEARLPHPQTDWRLSPSARPRRTWRLSK